MPHSANDDTAAAVSIRTDPTEQPSPADLCACGHPHSGHDRISSRYCDVTAKGGLNRGCVCRTSTGTYPGRM